MSWNPEQKGLDDALIALNRQEITKDDFGLTFGTATELFPLEQATPPNPYKLNGERVNRVDGKLEWQLEDSRRQAERREVVNEIQEKSKELDKSIQKSDEVIIQDQTENFTFGNEVTSQEPSKKPKVTLPPIHHVKQEDIEKITTRMNDGELTEEDVMDFFNSVSDMTQEIQNAVTNFANNQ